MSTWFVIVAVAAGTYALRASMFVVVGTHGLPRWSERPMALVGPAAIAALVASMMVIADGTLVAPALSELLATAAAFVAVRRTGNVMHAFTFGLPVFWAATAIGL